MTLAEETREGMAVGLHDVSKSFLARGGSVTRALSSLNLEIPSGEFCAMIGPTGCGKSTTLGLVSGLEPPTGGTVTTYGEPVKGIPPYIGYVFQNDALFPWKTVQDNIAIGLRFSGVSRHEARSRAREWVERVGLGGFENHYPAQLSGGMRKRASLAQCLITDPKIILMDEPFASLDAQTRLRMGHELLRLWQDTSATVLFITHDLDEAIALADRVVILTSRPATVKEAHMVDLARPRNVAEVRMSPDFDRLYRALWSSLRSEVEQSYRQDRN